MLQLVNEIPRFHQARTCSNNGALITRSLPFRHCPHSRTRAGIKTRSRSDQIQSHHFTSISVSLIVYRLVDSVAMGIKFSCDMCGRRQACWSINLELIGKLFLSTLGFASVAGSWRCDAAGPIPVPSLTGTAKRNPA